MKIHNENLKKVEPKEIDILLKELAEIANIFGASLLTLRGKRK